MSDLNADGRKTERLTGVKGMNDLLPPDSAAEIGRAHV